MLLVLIPTVWLALLALFAAICRVAADGDALQPPRGSESIGPRLVLPPLPSTRLLPSISSRRRRPTLSRESRRRRSAHRLR